jgi:hypothetical protein
MGSMDEVAVMFSVLLKKDYIQEAKSITKLLAT